MSEAERDEVEKEGYEVGIVGGEPRNPYYGPGVSPRISSPLLGILWLKGWNRGMDRRRIKALESEKKFIEECLKDRDAHIKFLNADRKYDQLPSAFPASGHLFSLREGV